MCDFKKLNEEDRQEINEYLDELQCILHDYNPKSQTNNIIIAIAFFVIWGVLTFAIGIWGTLLTAIIYFPLSKATEDKEYAESKKQLAYEACKMMDKSLKILDYSNEERNNGTIMEVSGVKLIGGNINLYNRFVERFPRMDSMKLKMLSKVEIGHIN